MERPASIGPRTLVADPAQHRPSGHRGDALDWGWRFRSLRSALAARLRDRSETGLAWAGASDEVVAESCLAGGAIAATLLLWSPLADPDAIAASSRLAGLPLGAAMLFAFVAITVAPTVIALSFQGAMFAASRHLMPRATSAALVTLATAAMLLLLHGPSLASVPAAVLVGALAMRQRLRHASLAPAIATLCGDSFVRCTLAALG
jgi:hypothetical protein